MTKTTVNVITSLDHAEQIALAFNFLFIKARLKCIKLYIGHTVYPTRSCKYKV